MGGTSIHHNNAAAKFLSLFLFKSCHGSLTLTWHVWLCNLFYFVSVFICLRLHVVLYFLTKAVLIGAPGCRRDSNPAT